MYIHVHVHIHVHIQILKHLPTVYVHVGIYIYNVLYVHVLVHWNLFSIGYHWETKKSVLIKKVSSFQRVKMYGVVLINYFRGVLIT